MTGSDTDKEVRAALTEDARAFLSRMEAAAAILVEGQVLGPKSFLALKAARPFEELGDGAQSIRGSASSVGADFLAESSAFVEECARRGASALELLVAHAQRVREMASFCTEAVREMGAMLTLYEEEASEEAVWLAMALAERGAEIQKSDDDTLARLAEAKADAKVEDDEARQGQPSSLPAAHLATSSPPGGDDAENETTFLAIEEFAFEETPGPPPLQRIFQDEAREVLLALKGHVENFVRTRALSALDPVEPLLNTLQGSAASVELPYLSLQAASALSLVGRVRRNELGDALEELLPAVNRLLGMLAIPPVEASATPTKSRPRVEMPDVFVGEVQRVLEAALAVADTLCEATTTKEMIPRFASEGARLFHRLKGTSLVVGATMLADEAHALMVACRNVTAATTLALALREGCERIRVLIPDTASAFAFDEPVLPIARARRSSVRPSEPPNFVSDGVLVIFREEIASSLKPINDAFARLDADPRDVVALEALQRSFHTLKGTAAAVGQPAISADAAAIEETLDGALEDTKRLDASFVERLRAAAKTALAPLGLADLLESDAVELSSDDLVDVSSEDEPAADLAPGQSQVETLEESDAASQPANEPGDGLTAANDWDGVVARCSGTLAFALDSPTPAGGDVDELAAIFAEEVEQLAPTIAQSLEQLDREPTDAVAAHALERYLHTLKGSAATVGRRDVSVEAESLRGVLEATGAGVHPLTIARLAALGMAIEQLLAVARRPAPQDELPADDAAGAREFAFEDGGRQGEDRGEELLRIFQQEAREALIALHGHVETLMATPSSAYAAEYIQRLFHTLKGAAATVGLTNIAAQAAELQTSMEEVLTSRRVPDAAFIQDLVARTNDLLRAIGVSPLVFSQEGDSGAMPSAPSLGDSADVTERRIFTGEVKSICRQASGNLRELLASTDPSTSVQLRSEIADLFHRLKGTAATVGAHAIADEAARATAAAAGKVAPREVADLLRASIVRIADLAGFERSDIRRRSREKGVVRESVATPDDRELWESFEQECAEILDALEKVVLSLEEDAQPKLLVSEIFRLVHTLKGAVNTVGLSPTGKVLHAVEDFLDELTKAAFMPPMRVVAEILIDTCKEVRQNLRTARSGWVETSLASVEARVAGAMRPGAGNGERRDASPGPATGGYKSGFDSAAIFGTSTHGSGAESAAKASLTSKSSDASASDSAPSEERAYIRVATSRLDTLMNLAGELVVSRSRMASRVGTLRFLYSELGQSRARLTNTVDTFRDQYEFANIGGSATHRLPRRESFARVDEGPTRDVFGSLELDEYGDIHILSRSLAEIGNDFEEAFRTLSTELSSFAEDAESLGGIISGIQGEVTRARMVPLDAVFTRLRIPIRDAATRDGKQVQVTTEGGDVNIDKTIADAILQPMLHLVRNAVAHGIESAAGRSAARKAGVGTIRLVARQQSGQIVIEIVDDGAGLDLASLRARGIALGLITHDVSVDDPRVKDLVFAAGLSTRAVAGDVAGRGVGGDIVKRTIERLNGALRVETTRGKGTAFIVTLPLTLAITRALLVKEGGSTYAVPLYFAERILDAESLDIVATGSERRVLLDGSYSRLRRLDDYFGDATSRAGGPALVLRVGDERMVLQVDAVLGQEEVVVKKAGELLEGHPLFAGVTLRGTGDLVLIVDVPGLLGELGGRPAPGTDDVAGPTRPVATEAVPASTSGGAATSDAASLEPTSQKKNKSPADRPASPHPLVGVRALVVDDSLSVRKVAEMHLKGLGVEVVLAVDGVDGLMKLREGRFDVVFTDLEMPRMHGYDFIRQLRLLAVHQNLPVVVVSSRSGQKHQDHARSVGATDYITKPFSAQSLEATIRRWLRAKA